MAQEPTVLLWCDIDMSQGSRKEGRTITFNGRAMEMCSAHEASTPVSELDRLMDEFGRKEGTTTRVKKVAAPKVQEAHEVGDDDLICPFGCAPAKAKDGSMEFASNRGLRMHLTRYHRGEVPA